MTFLSAIRPLFQRSLGGGDTEMLQVGALSIHGQMVSEEILHTALTEVVSLLNGRPLTHVSIDARDRITPNHSRKRWLSENVPNLTERIK